MSRASFAFVGFIGSSGGKRDRERAEELALVPHLERLVVAGVGELVSLDRHVGAAGASAGHDASARISFADAEPDPGRPRAGGLAEELRHPREDVLGRVRLPDALGELGQDLVRASTACRRRSGSPNGAPGTAPR